MKESGRDSRPPARVRMAAWILSLATRLLYATLRVRVEGETDPEALCREYGGVILVAWHGQSLVPIARSAGKNYYGMVSLSRDGDFLTECFRQLGWRTVRGSTGRHGVLAMKSALSLLRKPGTVLAITPDGPRGPARRAHPGVILLAGRSNCPILPVGIGIRHAWQLNSWDRFRIPLPFSRVRWIFGQPIFVDPTDDPEEIRRLLETTLTNLEKEAASPFATSNEPAYVETPAQDTAC
ncbi:MAG: lysophospholipid acyltransferase family protein [Capsulimonadales bacterium]|nr:lysophospholipid acyltransferase family protein [Capsulimonadales bacterium]